MTWTNTGGGDHDGLNWKIVSNTTVSGTHTNIGTFEIVSGVTITLVASTAFIVNSVETIIDGTINGVGKGYSGGSTGNGSGPGHGYYGGNEPAPYVGTGGGYGGVGGKWSGNPHAIGIVYGTSSGYDIDMGSGAGGQLYRSPFSTTGFGGGCVHIDSLYLDIGATGVINVTGGTTCVNCGAGSGGGIMLEADIIVNMGTLNANGGYPGGQSGGGGGRIKQFYNTSITDASSKTVIGGGTVANGKGADGTTYSGYRSHTEYVSLSQIIIF